MSGTGVFSVVCGLLGYLFPLASLFGIGAAIKGIVNDCKDYLCYAGLCVSLIILIINIIDMSRACGSENFSLLLNSAS